VAKEIKCSHLGVVGCDFVARGVTAGDVVEQSVEHLRSKHDMDMPDADAILKSGVSDDPELMHKKDVLLVIERLRAALDIEPLEEPIRPEPTIGKTPSQ
jgi:predicted small metal-binding protein